MWPSVTGVAETYLSRTASGGPSLTVFGRFADFVVISLFVAEGGGFTVSGRGADLQLAFSSPVVDL